MLKEELKNGLIVCHSKYHKKYTIISAKARQKDTALNWIDSVFYAPLYENEFEMFSRELNSFLKEFEIVK